MIELDDVVAAHGPGDPVQYIAIADHFLRLEDRRAAAAALDRAYGLAPGDADLRCHRAAILDELAIREHGLIWRYVPAGTFLMGSATGDPDERPVHARRVAAFWITDVPLSWASMCELLGWPLDDDRPDIDTIADDDRFAHYVGNRIRSSYCRSQMADGDERYHIKPAVAVIPRDAEALCARITTADVTYALPSEAQWEKAARGGLVSTRYAWGDAPPTRERCDFDRMGNYELLDPRAFPANGYGLHGMCGGVAEWTADRYDALAYRRAAAGDVAPPVIDEDAAQRVARGGSWIDCAEAVTVSYRAALAERQSQTPTIGVRLVRTE